MNKTGVLGSGKPAPPAVAIAGTKDVPATGPPSRTVGLNDGQTVLVIGLALAAMTWLVFGQTLGHEFVNYDDDLYVADNPAVSGGLNLKGIIWAFTHNVNVNWTPLTVISHMLDCQLYGTNAGWHHLTSVLLHMASVIVLFLVLKGMTAALWRSAFVAAVFAIHPLHVESVAWIAERRDVLSGLFFMLTIGAYARYARNVTGNRRRMREKSPNAECRMPKEIRNSNAETPGQGHANLDFGFLTSPACIWYCLTLLFFACGLMSKPMLVTLPFVLLVLDYWPLKRFLQPGDRLLPWHLMVEKIPLLVLSGAICAVTLFAQQEAITPLPLPVRLGNALVSCVVYLGQMFYPVGLAIVYPHPGHSLPSWKIITSFILLLGISVVAVAARRKQPWVLSGWLWYLGMLVPVIGMIQSGLRAHADRYTYLPQIGLYVLLTWSVAGLCAGGRHRSRVLAGIGAVILVALIFWARTQASYWRNSELLWTHTLAGTTDNAEAHVDLGSFLLETGRVDEAIAHFQKALDIDPDDCLARNNLGSALFQKGRVDEAILHFRRALEIEPDNAKSHNNLGIALAQKGQLDEAVAHFQKFLAFYPDNSLAHNNLGLALLHKGQIDQAIVQFQAAIAILPDNDLAHYNLGNALLQTGRTSKAIAAYRQALRIKPDYPEAQNDLAWVLATAPEASLRDGNQAVELAQQANRVAGGENPNLLGTLAAAYAEAGRFAEARQSVQQAIALARAAGRPDLVEQLNGELKCFEAGRPFRQDGQ